MENVVLGVALYRYEIMLACNCTIIRFASHCYVSVKGSGVLAVGEVKDKQGHV